MLVYTCYNICKAYKQKSSCYDAVQTVNVDTGIFRG